jgi:small GTP-binding protein
MSKPIVAIVGRPNVGKSTLFNQIGKKRVSIVDDMPGVTRDRIYLDAEWLNHEFTMIDTGGIEFDESNHILKSMRSQAEIAMEEADVILFLVDGRAGLTTSDEEVAKILRNTKKPVILGVNKIDSPQLEMNIYEFYNLGLGDPIPLSATNVMNLGDLLDAIVAAFPEEVPEEKDEDVLNAFLKQYYSSTPYIPKEILTRIPVPEPEVLLSYLSEKKEQKVSLLQPKRGDKAGLLKLAEDNVSVTFISSEVEEMLRTCSRLIVMRDRNIVGELTGSDLNQAQVMKTIAGGEAS